MMESDASRLRSAKKILVIGPGGSGKSTLASRLSEMLGIRVIHLDSLYWHPGWIEPPKDQWTATVDRLLEGETWIIDGNYSRTLERRLAACDTVIFLDFPRTTCVWRVIKRQVRYRKAKRPDMAEGCPEHFNLQFILWIWNYPTRTRPAVDRLLDTEANMKKVIRMQGNAEVEAFLANLSEQAET